MTSGAPGQLESPEQIHEYLLEELHQRQAEWTQAPEEDSDVARDRFLDALLLVNILSRTLGSSA
jgi:hypothetical protein